VVVVVVVEEVGEAVMTEAANADAAEGQVHGLVHVHMRGPQREDAAIVGAGAEAVADKLKFSS